MTKILSIVFAVTFLGLVQSEPPSNSYGTPLSAPLNSYGTPNYDVNYDYNGNNGHHGGQGGNGDHGDHGDHGEPMPYEFGYHVKDDYSGNDYNRKETSDGNQVRGEYRVQLPDGRTQIVTYYADWQTGFHADVRYEGTAHYPDQYNNNNNNGYNNNNNGYNYNNNNNNNYNSGGYDTYSNNFGNKGRPSVEYGAP